MRHPILVADPDDVFADLLDTFLTQRGYDVLRVRDGRRALTALRSSRLGAVIVALDLPSVDGLELATSLASDECPPVVLTSRTPLPLSWTGERLRRVGIGAAVSRPCPLEHILHALEKATGRPAPRAAPSAPSLESDRPR